MASLDTAPERAADRTPRQIGPIREITVTRAADGLMFEVTLSTTAGSRIANAIGYGATINTALADAFAEMEENGV